MARITNDLSCHFKPRQAVHGCRIIWISTPASIPWYNYKTVLSRPLHLRLNPWLNNVGHVLGTCRMVKAHLCTALPLTSVNANHAMPSANCSTPSPAAHNPSVNTSCYTQHRRRKARYTKRSRCTKTRKVPCPVCPQTPKDRPSATHAKKLNVIQNKTKLMRQSQQPSWE